ncbi:hypothetical protein [Methylobacterium soli]|uniref:Uncharacterized protein n=1 Tax=Methylobacterium soli TaxID=553447 RepID=A0A6L3T0V4_9HYPH|nr:hypothetical protein [Methylobacterium soli]KAB1079390.1 hypothetical protein F6X53_11345 [Methylobacterium soli]GJE42064.1 hypothetical protein AEGHOMDF_1235 [Methylobacterium soli]
MSKNVGGNWNAVQSNGPIVNFRLQQNDDRLQGVGTHSNGSVSGTGNGSVSDTGFLFVIDWSNGSKGEYNGSFGLDGRLTGITFDRNQPDSQATWHSTKVFES